MSETAEQLTDDQSHYEISLTAGQAFVAFVLLLLSLAASFAFGLMIGRGQSEDRLVVKKEPAVINEGNVVAGAKRNDGKIVELGADDFKQAAPAPAKSDTTVTTTAPPVITESVATNATDATHGTNVVTAPATETAAPPVKVTEPVKVEAPKAAPTPAKAVYAQLLSTGDQKTAEALAAKLIDKGFISAYVERAGTIFKVRVRFPSEADARAAEPKLREFARDVWIVK